jgi:hypothetical protein
MGGGAEKTAASTIIQKEHEKPLQRPKHNPDKQFLTELHHNINDYFRRTGRPQKSVCRYTLKRLPC